MKYKNIKSMAHNFLHSFLSYENYLDNGYIVDDFRELARQAEGQRVGIHWLPEGSPLPDNCTRRLTRAVAAYQDWLRKHAENHDVDLNHIKEFKTEMYMLPSHQLSAEYYVLDDRGREYVGTVSF
jgi:hypothetical protein